MNAQNVEFKAALTDAAVQRKENLYLLLKQPRELRPLSSDLKLILCPDHVSAVTFLSELFFSLYNKN